MSACVSSIEKTGCRWAIEGVFPLWMPAGASFVDTRRVRQVALAQRTFGDYLVPFRDGRLYGVEVKAEAKFTGNFFLESWSNRTPDPQYRRDGWLLTLRADVLLYFFVDAEVGYAIPVTDLRRWALNDGNLYRYKETAVDRSIDGRQKNVTVGFLVPVEDVAAAVGPREYRREDGVWRQV